MNQKTEASQSVDDLLPCPFCGAAAQIDEHPAHSHTGQLAGIMPDYPGSFTVECIGARCNTGQIADTRTAAVAMWNRRAALKAHPAPTEATATLLPITDRHTESKTNHIIERDGYKKVGYVLENAAGDYCLSAQSAVRWLSQPHYWRLMHEQDGSLFGTHTSTEAAQVTVTVERGGVYITKGVQSFRLAYEGETRAEQEWYAGQLRAALAQGEDSARLDAERYQFLRYADLDELARIYWPDAEVPVGEELDDIIDRARASAETGGGEIVISIETATVYRGGGRRWFTKRAACRAEAKAKIKTRCECDYCDHPEMPGCPTEHLPCAYHDDSPRAEKILRRLTRAFLAAPQPQEQS